MDIPPPSKEECPESTNIPKTTTTVSRKKSRIRNLIFTILTGVGIFAIAGKPWPEPRPLPKESVKTKSQAREIITHEEIGGFYSRTYDRNGELIFEEHFKNMKLISKNMFHDGKPFGLYPEEKESNPDLTPKEYITFLAKALDSHEKLHVFFKEFWRYAHDSPDQNDPLKEGTNENHGEYVQTPAETIARVKNQRMLGDCDDLAIISYAIVSQQPGRNPHIIDHGDHVYTAWIEERKHGGYDSFNIDLGLTCNGNNYDPEKDTEKGTYASVTDALVVLLKQHEPISTFSKGLNHCNQPPYCIVTTRPIVWPNHRMGITRFVPAQAFHPKHPFPWSYDEILIVSGTAYLVSMQLGRRCKRGKKNVNQT